MTDFSKIEQEIESFGLHFGKSYIKSMSLLLDVARAADDIKWRSIEKDNMEFATTCWKKDAITKALTALKEHCDE